jgi:hypothetical protein
VHEWRVSDEDRLWSYSGSRHAWGRRLFFGNE